MYLYDQGVSDDDVKSAWDNYKRLVEIAMREKAQVQVQCTVICLL